ncbi:MAG: manganese catalase family protein [Lachnospiraceae bacterium]|nr:manganese catalase family protein [Lachnospiraceae bacterium]
MYVHYLVEPLSDVPKTQLDYFPYRTTLSEVFKEYTKWNITAASLGTEEMAHFEMVATIVHQLTRNLTPEEIKESGFGDYYIDHTLGVWPQAAGGVPQNACEFQVKADPITDIVEDMAAEQKARSTYDNILRVVKDPDVIDPIRFLRAREVVHFQRFGEAMRSYTSKSA